MLLGDRIAITKRKYNFVKGCIAGSKTNIKIKKEEMRLEKSHWIHH